MPMLNASPTTTTISNLRLPEIKALASDAHYTKYVKTVFRPRMATIRARLAAFPAPGVPASGAARDNPSEAARANTGQAVQYNQGKAARYNTNKAFQTTIRLMAQSNNAFRRIDDIERRLAAINARLDAMSRPPVPQPPPPPPPPPPQTVNYALDIARRAAMQDVAAFQTEQQSGNGVPPDLVHRVGRAVVLGFVNAPPQTMPRAAAAPSDRSATINPAVASTPDATVGAARTDESDASEVSQRGEDNREAAAARRAQGGE